MIPLSLSDIGLFVRSKLDELSDNSGFVNADTLDITKIIEASAVTVIRTIHLAAPNVLLNGEVVSSMPVNVDGDGVGRISVPRNFMRLVSLQVNGWSRPVQTLISEDSVEYRKQQNRYLRGTPRRPVAALTHNSVDETMTIELYSCSNADNSLKHLEYIPEPVLENSIIMICPKLKQACLYAITAEVLRCFNEMNRAQMFDGLAQQSLNPSTDNDRIYPANGEKTIE